MWAAAQVVPAAGERRLRSMLRHERVAVAMAVAEATHHSSRGEKSATVIREEEVHETYVGSRAQKRPPPGERPGILAEHGPQRSDRTMRRSIKDTHPTVGLPVLAGASRDLHSRLPHPVSPAVEEGGGRGGGGAGHARGSPRPWWLEPGRRQRRGSVARAVRSGSFLPLPRGGRGRRRGRGRLQKPSSSRGRARRRHRQWVAPSWFFGRSEFPGIMVVWK